MLVACLSYRLSQSGCPAPRPRIAQLQGPPSLFTHHSPLTLPSEEQLMESASSYPALRTSVSSSVNEAAGADGNEQDDDDKADGVQ